MIEVTVKEKLLERTQGTQGIKSNIGNWIAVMYRIAACPPKSSLVAVLL